MTTKKIPLFGDAYRNVDEIEANEKSVVIYDGWRDELGGAHRRPGLTSFATLTTNIKIDALYWWDDKAQIVAISAGAIYTINTAGAYQLRSGATLLSGASVSFDTDGTYCFMAAGSRIVYMAETGNTIELSVPNAPTKSTHVAFIDGYLIANEVGTRRFKWSNVNDSLAWGAASFASAEGAPDEITAIVVKNREIYLFGSQSVELWESSGDTAVFSRVPGGFIQVGCSAPTSILYTDNFLFWLSDDATFVRYGGGGVEKVSSPYDKVLQDFTTVEDCIAYRIDVVGRTFLLFNFPTENRTLVYNATNDNWTEWGKWNSDTTAYDRFLGHCHCYCKGIRTNLIGSREHSEIYTLKEVNLTDDGDEVRFATLSGHVDHGSSIRKRNNKFRMRAKRGASVEASGESSIAIRWCDNGKFWSREHSISLGSQGPQEILIALEPRGVYNTRQWEIVASDLSSEIILVDAEEDFDFLR